VYAAVLALALVPYAATGCGGDEPDVDVVGDWVFVSGHAPGGELAVPARDLASLTFADGDAGGRGPCNDYGSDGGYGLHGSELDLGQLSRTFQGCDGAAGAFERAYLDALSAVDRASRDGDALELTGDGVALRFAPMPAWPERAVVGHTWRLRSVTTGTVMAGTVTTAAADRGRGGDGLGDPAMLYLTSDHRASGSTGCRSFRGRWLRSVGATTVRLRLSGACPEHVLAQDALVTEVLGEFTAVVRSRAGATELVLTGVHSDADGERSRLVYRR
jgi:heat shock protein HslJ